MPFHPSFSDAGSRRAFGVASLHVTCKLRAGDVSPRTVLLRMDRTVLNAVVELRSTHAPDLRRLDDFKTQTWQGIQYLRTFFGPT